MKCLAISITFDVINGFRYYLAMITEIYCKDTKALFQGRRVKRFANIEAVAMRKLQQ